MTMYQLSDKGGKLLGKKVAFFMVQISSPELKSMWV